jgi:hypothetical protein
VHEPTLQDLELARERLRFLQELGQGEFDQLMLMELTGALAGG